MFNFFIYEGIKKHMFSLKKKNNIDLINNPYLRVHSTVYIDHTLMWNHHVTTDIYVHQVATDI